MAVSFGGVDGACASDYSGYGYIRYSLHPYAWSIKIDNTASNTVGNKTHPEYFSSKLLPLVCNRCPATSTGPSGYRLKSLVTVITR